MATDVSPPPHLILGSLGVSQGQRSVNMREHRVGLGQETAGVEWAREQCSEGGRLEKLVVPLDRRQVTAGQWLLF